MIDVFLNIQWNKLGSRRIRMFLGHPDPSLFVWIRIRILKSTSKKVRKPLIFFFNGFKIFWLLHTELSVHVHRSSKITRYRYYKVKKLSKSGFQKIGLLVYWRIRTVQKLRIWIRRKIITDLDLGGLKTYGTLALAFTDLILNIFVLLLDLKFWYYYLLYIWDQKWRYIWLSAFSGSTRVTTPRKSSTAFTSL